MAKKAARELKEGDRIEFPGENGKEKGEVIQVKEAEFEGRQVVRARVETSGGGFYRPQFEPDEDVTVLDSD